jgi:hypothetical protein
VNKTLIEKTKKDKIIFWLAADLTYFGLAKFLQDKHDCDLFAIIDITQKPKKFFQEQDLVKFQKIWFYHDHILKNHNTDLQYLSSFEKKYNINLWSLAHNERIFYRFNQFHKFSSEEILSILEQECKLFEKILDETKPDFLIMYMPTLHHNELFYEICKSKGIKLLILRPTAFGYRYMISQEVEKIDELDNKQSKYDRSSKELFEFLKGNDSFKQAENYLSEFQNSKFQYLKAIMKFLFTSNSNEKTHYTYYGRIKFRVFRKVLLYTLKKKYREYFMKKHLLHQVNDKISFVYFPLHIEQEQILLIRSPFYTNQIEVIRHIAKSLPMGYKLCVKEHPMMGIRGWRSISDYKEIMNIPNTELIHPSLKSEDILKKCSLVITINGTSSLEAAFYQKPSITFANSDFSHLPSIGQIKDLNDLPHIIRKYLQEKVSLQSLNEYVDLVDENSFEFDLGGLSNKMLNHFYFGGFLVDNEISSQSMTLFLEKNITFFNTLVDEFIKKIIHYKNQ